LDAVMPAMSRPALVAGCVRAGRGALDPEA
jgi:hypothetical protein